MSVSSDPLMGVALALNFPLFVHILKTKVKDLAPVVQGSYGALWQIGDLLLDSPINTSWSFILNLELWG